MNTRDTGVGRGDTSRPSATSILGAVISKAESNLSGLEHRASSSLRLAHYATAAIVQDRDELRAELDALLQEKNTLTNELEKAKNDMACIVRDAENERALLTKELIQCRQEREGLWFKQAEV